MSHIWTVDQRKVIDARGKNLLVSAAAGSGKTAVLVERIIKKITDPENPVDIDRLLIVTFTNAAAAQMRERIGKAIEEALKEKPDNVHLQRQETLLHSAQITTIHSFCLYIIRNYFHKIDLDPAIRIGEEGELKLLKAEIADAILESAYETREEEFLHFVETFATGKHDLPIKELILQLYEFSVSDPWPEKWLDRCLIPYQCPDEEEFYQTEPGQVCQSILTQYAKAWIYQMKEALSLCGEPDGPDGYMELLTEETKRLEELEHISGMDAYYDKINCLSFKRLPAIRKFAGDPNKKMTVMELRNGVKDSIKKMKQRFFARPPKEMIERQHENEAVVRKLIELTKEFSVAFLNKKLDKNLMDYNDMEHFALKILIHEDTKEPTPTAVLLRQNYEEIMVDEYQDSNYVQEAILTAISKEKESEYNMFMVGDVKQSIYRFRMARPELFMEKYDSYELNGDKKERIDLHKNFRSRQEVIDTVNDVFLRVMAKDIGNIDYNQTTALYPGGDFKEPEIEKYAADQFETEVLIGDLDGEYAAEEFADAKEIEARIIADRIKAMMGTQFVFDAEQNTFRKIKYEDIVILLRSIQGYGDLLIQVLKDHSIPARATSGTGYFSAIEVKTMLNLLRLIDNPRQDIAMTAVLTSPIVNLSGEELAVIRAQYREEEHFYQAVFSYEADGEDIEVKAKVAHFLERLKRFRSFVKYKPIHQLLYDIMEETGYYSYVYAMPGGAVRQGNLQMLLEKAMTFEKTSYRGLFHFIRYMDQLQKYDVDFGEAAEEEEEDVVRIMSIHKSKGLEFPVVILAAMGKQFNQQDIRGRMLLHPKLGIGIDRIDPLRRLKSVSLIKQIHAVLSKTENWGEELRVLYVAMTRAKEKLILTGTLKKAGAKLAGLEYTRTTKDGYLSYLKRMNALSYFDWVLPALYTYPGKYKIKLLGPAELMKQEIIDELNRKASRMQLQKALSEYDLEIYHEIDRKFSYCYPYEKEKEMKMKLSVSEMKQRSAQFLKEEEAVHLFEEEAVIPYIPQFMLKQNTEGAEMNQGALKGTAMHRILECYDFARAASSLHEQVETMLNSNRIDPATKNRVTLEEIERFLKSDLAIRMNKAAEKGKLYKERTFMMGRPAHEVLPDTDSEEIILIQGMIDVFFEEEDQLVLVDYKTDWVLSEQELINRYNFQLKLYAQALDRALGKRVKEKLIYSFCLQKDIQI